MATWSPATPKSADIWILQKISIRRLACAQHSGRKADNLVLDNNGNQIGCVVRDVRVLPFWGYAPDGRTPFGTNCVGPPVRETFTDYAPASEHISPADCAAVIIRNLLLS
jgi:hypothetical protein